MLGIFNRKKETKEISDLQEQVTLLSARIDANYGLAFAALAGTSDKHRQAICRSLKHFIGDMGEFRGVGLLDGTDEQIYRDELSKIMQRMVLQLENPPTKNG